MISFINLKIKLKSFFRNSQGGIFDEALLLAAKGLVLLIILTGFIFSIYGLLEKFSGYIQDLSNKLPES